MWYGHNVMDKDKLIKIHRVAMKIVKDSIIECEEEGDELTESLLERYYSILCTCEAVLSEKKLSFEQLLNLDDAKLYCELRGYVSQELGFISQKKDYFDDAYKYTKLLIEYNNNDSQVYYNLFLICNELKFFDEAKRYINKAKELSTNPYNIKTYGEFALSKGFRSLYSFYSSFELLNTHNPKIEQIIEKHRKRKNK